MKTKLTFMLTALASLFMMSVPVIAETRLVLSDGSDSRVSLGSSYDLTIPESRFVAMFRVPKQGIDSGVRIRVWGVDEDPKKFFEVQFAAPEGQTLTEGVYENANPHRWDPQLPHLVVKSSYASCNYEIGAFEVTQLKVSDDGKKLLAFAANFTHRCDSQENPLIGEVYYNSDTTLASCNATLEGLTAEIKALNETIVQLTSDYSELNAEKESLEEELEASGTDMLGVQSTNEKIIAELEASNIAKSNLEAEILSLKSDNQSFVSANQDLTSTIEKLQKKLKRLRRRNRRLRRLTN